MTNHQNKNNIQTSANTPRKPIVKINRNKNEVILIAKFIEPSDAQLTALSSVLFSLLNKIK